MLPAAMFFEFKLVFFNVTLSRFMVKEHDSQKLLK
jgi:hypothetical protein